MDSILITHIIIIIIIIVRDVFSGVDLYILLVTAM